MSSSGIRDYSAMSANPDLSRRLCKHEVARGAAAASSGGTPTGPPLPPQTITITNPINGATLTKTTPIMSNATYASCGGLAQSAELLVNGALDTLPGGFCGLNVNGACSWPPEPNGVAAGNYTLQLEI
jgi:Bacterial Ig domain